METLGKIFFSLQRSSSEATHTHTHIIIIIIILVDVFPWLSSHCVLLAVFEMSRRSSELWCWRCVSPSTVTLWQSLRLSERKAGRLLASW